MQEVKLRKTRTSGGSAHGGQDGPSKIWVWIIGLLSAGHLLAVLFWLWVNVVTRP